MDLLCDTCVLIKMLSSPETLHADCLSILDSADSRLFLSVASIWEIGIKHRKGRLGLASTAANSIAINQFGMTLVAIEPQDIATMELLPKELHGDPFDHIIFSQAINRAMRLVTTDSQAPNYERHGLLLLPKVRA